MTIPEKASFSFVEFKVLQSQFKFSDNVSNELSLNFNPSGKHFIKTNIFKLFLSVHVQLMPDNKDFIEIDTEATFAIKTGTTGIEDLMKFFVINAPAIVFPYIRSYISTLSIQSGCKPILLPTLNLIGISEQLRMNIESITD